MSLARDEGGSFYVTVSIVAGLYQTSFGIPAADADHIADELAKRIKDAGREGRRQARGIITPQANGGLLVPRG